MLTAGKWTLGKYRCWIVNCSRGSASHGMACTTSWCQKWKLRHAAKATARLLMLMWASDPSLQVPIILGGGAESDSYGGKGGGASGRYICVNLEVANKGRAACTWLTTRRCREDTVTTAGVCRTRGSWQSASEPRQLSSCECLPLGVVVVWCECSMTSARAR
jgi:hypothetical protein